MALGPDHRHHQPHARFFQPFALGRGQCVIIGEWQFDDAARALHEL